MCFLGFVIKEISFYLLLLEVILELFDFFVYEHLVFRLIIVGLLVPLSLHVVVQGGVSFILISVHVNIVVVEVLSRVPAIVIWAKLLRSWVGVVKLTSATRVALRFLGTGRILKLFENLHLLL